MKLVELDVEDMAKLAKWEKECFKEPWRYDQLVQESRRNPFFHGIALQFQEEFVGYAIVWLMYEQAQVARVAILPPFRNNGFGNQWMDKIKTYCQEKGCMKCTLEVRPSNTPAISMYEKAGFRCIHTIRKHYSDGEDAKVYENNF